MYRRVLRHIVTFAVFLWCVPAAPGQGFALLNFPSQAAIDLGTEIKWDLYTPGQPLTLTYSIDADFLAESGLPREEIETAVEDALQSWSDASNGFVRFERFQFESVLNGVDLPLGDFVGPGFDLWVDLATACNGDAACLDELGLPGWGAHIDFFSRPANWTNVMGGVTWETTECNLGFAAYYRDASALRSVDIILNEKWDWTTTPEVTLEKHAEVLRHPIGCGCRDHNAQKIEAITGTKSSHSANAEARGDAECVGLQLTVDLQTVLVHEIGHALGLDHPDQAGSNGSVILNPLVFTPEASNSASPESIMFADYSGVKRDLTPDDIGGLAFLYRPRWGDVDADGLITIADWFNAYNFVAGLSHADPYDVNILDFGARDGLIQLDEITILTGWLSGELEYPLATREIRFKPPIASEITLKLDPRPMDIGLGGSVAVDVYIENPNAREIRGYDLQIVFDNTLFTDPVVVYTGLIPDAVSIPPSTSDCHLRLGEVATFTLPPGVEGLAATIYFDFDLANAVGAMTFQFDVSSAIIPVTDPVIHNFGLSPAYPDEVLTFVPAIGVVNDYDVNDSTVIDMEDLYDFEQVFLSHDVDQDGDRDETDSTLLSRALRQSELIDAFSPN